MSEAGSVVATRAFPALARLLLPWLLLAAALTVAVLVLSSGAAHAGGLIDDPLPTESVEPTVGVERAVETASTLSGASATEPQPSPDNGEKKVTEPVVKEVAGPEVGRVVSHPEPQMPGRENTGGPASVVSSVERTAPEPATSVQDTPVDPETPAAKSLTTTRAAVRDVARPVQSAIDQAKDTAADTGTDGRVQQSVRTITGEAEKAVTTVTGETEEAVGTLTRVLRDAETAVADVPVVGDVAGNVSVTGRVDETVGVAVDIVFGTATSGVVDQIGRTLEEVWEDAIGPGLSEADGVTAEVTVGSPDMALLGPARASRSGRQVGGHWALISQREVTQNNPIPAEGSPSQDRCQRVDPSRTDVPTPYRPTPYRPTPAGIIGAATGTGGSPGGGMSPGWAATLPSTWLAAPMVGPQPRRQSALRTPSGPSLDPGFSPD
jgi:hypothetical protein